jgi:hypothetical protein
MATSAKVAEAYVDLQLRTAAFKAAIADATNETRKFSTQLKAEMESSRLSIRLLSQDLGVGIPRGLQTVIARLPGVSQALSAAFSSIAVLALIDVVYKAGEKITEFVQKNEEAARKNASANYEFTASLVKSNAQLAVTNDRLDIDIAKLSHKPTNNLALALDEAKLSAIDLADKLEKAIDKERELLEISDTKWYQQLGTTASNETTKDSLNSYQGDVNKTNNRFDGEVAGAKSVADAQAIEVRRRQELLRVTEAYYNTLTGEIALRKEYQSILTKNSDTLSDTERDRYRTLNEQFSQRKNSNGDQSTILPALTNLQGQIGVMGNGLQLEVRNDQLTNQDAAAQAAHTATDEAKKAAADRLRLFETNYEQEKVQYGMSLSQEAAYWGSKIASFTKGSQEYLSVLTKFATASTAEGKYLEGVSKNYRDRTGTLAPLTIGDRGTDADSAAISKGLEQQAALRASLTEAATAYRLQTGAINEHDASLLITAAHTDEYKAKLSTLTSELAKLRGEEMDFNGQNVDPQNATKQQAVQNQIDELSGKAKIQSLTDAQATLSTTWTGMIDSVFDELIKRSKDTVGQLKQISEQIIDGINSQLAKSLTGQKADFAKVLQNGSEQLAKSGIQKLEGLGLSALGFGGGKRDGSSAAAALYVQMAAGGSTVSGSSIPGFADLFPASHPNVTGPGSGIASSASKGLLGLLNNSNWASSLFGGNLFGSGSIFGHFALGGNVMAGVPIDVGEMGRERFVPSVPGRIVPNNQLGNGAPSIGYIDARGTDPVQTGMAVQRAMQATHAQSVRDASHAMQERSRRTPH